MLLSNPFDVRLRQGGQIFLVVLGVFFFASMVLYFMFATWRREQFVDHALPRNFFSSTALLFATSFTLVGALRSVRYQQLPAMRFYLGISLVLGVLFVVVQSWGMRELIDFGLARNPTGGLWGMVVVLAVVHALHVVGGLVGLVVIYRAALRDRYDHEWHWPIQFVGNYWHFLDLVWIIMLVSFWMTSNGFI